MVLHEYYFGNLTKVGLGDPEQSSRFQSTVELIFGDNEVWKTDFVGVSSLRGVEWAICYQNPKNGRLSNHWISLHEKGNVAGFIPILVLDVWEHAYLIDYAPSERQKYIEAFFANIDWKAVDERLVNV